MAGRYEAATPQRVAWLTAGVRQWLYGIATAAIPLLTIYGIVDQAQAPLWGAMAMAVLGLGTASLHVPPSVGAPMLPPSGGGDAASATPAAETPPREPDTLNS